MHGRENKSEDIKARLGEKNREELKAVGVNECVIIYSEC